MCPHIWLLLQLKKLPYKGTVRINKSICNGGASGIMNHSHNFQIMHTTFFISHELYQGRRHLCLLLFFTSFVLQKMLIHKLSEHRHFGCFLLNLVSKNELLAFVAVLIFSGLI